MRIYTDEDCDKAGYGISIMEKVVVVSPDALPGSDTGQLFFCIAGDSAGSGDENLGQTVGAVSAVSLSCGEHYRFWGKDIIGTLKPELLPEEAKLQLSQIRPSGAKSLSQQEPQYSGYCFLEDGRYASGVWLCCPEEVEAYVKMQVPYQYRILICDRDDFAVLDIVQGVAVFPSKEDMEGFRRKTEWR